MSPQDEVLLESLRALDLSPRVLERWLEDRRRFCLAHGGRKYYAGVLAIIEDALRLKGPC